MSRSSNEHPIMCDYCCYESFNEDRFINLISKNDYYIAEEQHICTTCWEQMDEDET